MKHEKCCGAVVYTKIGDQVYYLLVQNLKGVYGFPKGHMEANETETETAIREIKEEVGLDVDLNTSFRTTDSYMIPGMQDTMKEVVYFAAYYENQTLVYQKEELTSAALYTYDEAMERFQYARLKRILTEADCYLTSSQQ